MSTGESASSSRAAIRPDAVAPKRHRPHSVAGEAAEALRDETSSCASLGGHRMKYSVPVRYYEYSVTSGPLGPGPTGPAPVPPGRRSCCGYSEELHPDGLQMRLKGALLLDDGKVRGPARHEAS
jgi:hypothetical protein